MRWSIPGDRARILADGRIELLGRDSVTINSGGEKIFAEEVERALTSHPAVYDVVVVGRPSERWGSEVVAVVQLAEGKSASDEEMAAACRTQIASYKIPKAFIHATKIQRSPAGKADYRWANSVAANATTFAFENSISSNHSPAFPAVAAISHRILGFVALLPVGHRRTGRLGAGPRRGVGLFTGVASQPTRFRTFCWITFVIQQKGLRFHQMNHDCFDAAVLRQSFSEFVTLVLAFNRIF